MLKHLVMIYLFFFSAWCVRLSSQKGENQRKRRLNEIPFNPLQTRFPSLTTTKFKSDSSGDASPIELIWKGLLFNTTFHSGARKLEKYVLNIYQHVQNSLFRQMFAVKLVQNFFCGDNSKIFSPNKGILNVFINIQNTFFKFSRSWMKSREFWIANLFK